MTFKLLTICLLFLIYSVTTAMDTDELIRKCISAHGYKNIEELRTAVLEGYAETLRETVEIKVWFKTPDMIRSEMTFDNMQLVQGFDGNNGWYIPPAGLKDMVYDMPEEMLMKMKAQSGFLSSPLVNYNKKGSKVYLEGNEEVNGKDTYKLKYISKGGAAVYFYIDTETFFHIKSLNESFQRGRKTITETYYKNISDFKGIKLPKTIVTYIDGKKVNEINFSTIKLDRKSTRLNSSHYS